MSKKKKRKKKRSDAGVSAAANPGRQAGGTTGDVQTDGNADTHEERSPTTAAGGTPAAGAAGTAAPRALEREQALRKAAYELFLAEGGGDLEALMENGQCTARAYTSQIRAAQEGGQGWGPTVTPYEDRMTRSLQFQLIRERRKWIEDCRKRIEAAIEEAREGEADEIAEHGERLAEEARTEAAIMDEAVAMAQAEYERDKGRPLPGSNGAFKQVEAVPQHTGNSP